MSIIQGNSKVSGGGYEIDQSIRFNDDDSSSLSRTSGSADSERKLASTSIWLKRSNLTGRHTIYSVNPAGSTGAANQITMVFENSGTNGDCITYNNGAVNRQSTSVYRDVSAWYHLCQIFDTTEATAADRVKTYINGTLLTDINIGQDFSLNSNTAFGQNGVVHYLGRGGSTQYFDGYMAEIVFTVGQSVAVTDFGEFNDDGVWVPKAFAGGYGSNGFYITGEDSADLGADYSGNANDFTSSGLTSDDQRGDTPTANHATWNPLFFRRTGSYKPTFANGNLYVAGQSSQVSHTGTTISSSGKHYAEFLVNNGSSSITGPGVVRSYWDGGLAQSYASNFGGSYYGDNGTRYYNATSDSQTAPGANRVGIEVDFANNEVEYFIVTSGGTKTSQGGKLTSANGIDFDGEGIFTATLHDSSARNITAYFEEADWYGTPNAGYKALSTANLPTPAIKDGSKYFQTTLYTGNGTAIGSGGNAVSQIENSTFQPDFVWIKRRNAVVEHALTDAVRGVTKELNSDDLTAESTVAEGLTTFGSAGFTVGSDASYNTSAAPYVAWQWLAGNGTTSNTDGSITTTTSVNQASGISIMTYTGNATAGATIGHGLGAKPGLVIAKSRGTGDRWWVYHEDQGATKYGILELSNAFVTSSIYWNNTEPDSSVITLGTGQTNVSGGSMLAYAFTEIPGFSAIGAYTGNGSANGAFIHTGFKPAWLMIKRTNSTSSWGISDTKRLGYNVDNDFIMADTVAAEVTFDYVDLLSNGFKIRNSGTAVGVSGSNYVYLAFAEHSFGGDGVAPATAR
jgi:hypothetical protein